MRVMLGDGNGKTGEGRGEIALHRPKVAKFVLDVR